MKRGEILFWIGMATFAVFAVLTAAGCAAPLPATRAEVRLDMVCNGRVMHTRGVIVGPSSVLAATHALCGPAYAGGAPMRLAATEGDSALLEATGERWRWWAVPRAPQVGDRACTPRGCGRVTSIMGSTGRLVLDRYSPARIGDSGGAVELPGGWLAGTVSMEAARVVEFTLAGLADGVPQVSLEGVWP